MKCGILSKLRPGDLVIADKGITIHNILRQGVTVHWNNLPPRFLSPQFTPTEVPVTADVARARIDAVCPRTYQAIQDVDS